MGHSHHDAALMIMKAMQPASGKLRRAATFFYNHTARKIVYGVERDIKMGKNAQGRKALDIHISKLLKTEEI